MAPNPRHLILKFLLGAEGEAMSAREAVAACGLFGIRENSVRVALVRLAAAGMIEAAGRGAYRLGANATGLAEDVSTWRAAESRVRDWSGAWIAVYCGALSRSNRAALSRRDRALDMLGFREIDHECFVRPDNLVGGVAAVRERLYKLGLDSAAAVFLATEFDAAREARVRELWDGAALTRSYRQTREQLERWLAQEGELERDVAARESFLMGSTAIRQLVFDPLLPDPLVDTAERRAFVDTVLRYDTRGHQIWRQLRLIPLPGSEAAASATH
ncbi:MAG TPA: PaaX family transcriptional regulator C-terminal domain-containing protein [Moraxellaceae bacterium]